MKKSLIALAIGTFGLGIAEFVIMGILGNIVSSLQISVTQAGHLISAYAIGVFVGAPRLLLVRKYPLKKILLILVSIILLGNLLASLSPNYWTLLIARFISGFPHGAYFGVASIVATRLADPGKCTQAVSIMVGGMTIATLVGVPLGTFLTTIISWRLAFLMVALGSLIALLGIRYWIPKMGGLPDIGFKGQFKSLKTPAPWFIFLGTLFGQIGIYCWYSYVDPLMTVVSGFPVESLSWLMILAGVGMVAGNLISGKLSDRYSPGLVASFVQLCMVFTLLLIFFFSPIPWISVILMIIGAAALFGGGSPLQSLIIRFSKGGEMLGASAIQIAFNVGNAVAAYLGGLVINAGFDFRYPALIGVPLALFGSILLFIMHFRYERKL